jgi:hypothetical protein
VISEENRERVGRNVAIWIIANVLILVCVPVFHYIYLDDLVEYEYANGLRTSATGDTLIIPLIGGFIFLVVTLFVINFVAASYVYLSYFRKDNGSIDNG